MAQFVRLYTGKDGKSHFEELKPPGGGVENSPLQKATGITFRRAEPGEVIDWHPAPRRQYVITLAGQGEIEIGDGTVRQFGPGDVMLAEDLTGQGHITRSVGKVARVSAQVPLA